MRTGVRAEEVPEEGLWKRQRAVLRRALSVGKVGACRRGSGVRCGDGSGVRVVLCIPVLAGNGGDHGIYARTYMQLASWFRFSSTTCYSLLR
jgi:hypothetical protein